MPTSEAASFPAGAVVVVPFPFPVCDLAMAGLHVRSVVRPIKLACIEPGRILRTIGTLPDQAAEAVFDAIRGRVGQSRFIG